MEVLIDCLRRIFPKRSDDPPYFPWPNRDGSQHSDYMSPPMMPADVFAAAGYVLQHSGAYHHVVAEVTGHSSRVRRQLTVSLDFIQSARETARAWRAFNPDLHYNRSDPSVLDNWLSNEGAPILKLLDAWTEVFGAARSPEIFVQLSSEEAPPDWWISALFLLVAADEAARDLGFIVSEEEDQPWITAATSDIIFKEAKRLVSSLAELATSRPIRFNGLRTIAEASEEVVCVLPKARTASVGCTMRSLSHHLALLPPAGIARAAWTPYLHLAPPDERHMNLLLIPFPYTIPASAFETMPGFAGEGSKKWGTFAVRQTWLASVTKSKLLEFVQAMVEEATRDVQAIHGIVFPELALDQDSWNHLTIELPKTFPELELIVAGVSKERERDGNFVRVAVFQRSSGVRNGAGKNGRIALESSREKHHRWTLDRDEILAYGLEGRLSPSVAWAEDIDLVSRRVDFAVIRQSSVISAMICEDLARVDPCQELIRAIGPSIVFALLMDAPQLKTRWPARYATILAEDPGTAVLTLTSRGLMTRQHHLGKFISRGDSDRIVALWRDDDRSDPIEISCPNGAHAIRLTLSGTAVGDRSLDGREDRSAVAWRYANHRPVCLPGATEHFKDVLGEDDLALQDANRSR